MEHWLTCGALGPLRFSCDGLWEGTLHQKGKYTWCYWFPDAPSATALQDPESKGEMMHVAPPGHLFYQNGKRRRGHRSFLTGGAGLFEAPRRLRSSSLFQTSSLHCIFCNKAEAFDYEYSYCAFCNNTGAFSYEHLYCALNIEAKASSSKHQCCAFRNSAEAP